MQYCISAYSETFESFLKDKNVEFNGEQEKEIIFV